MEISSNPTSGAFVGDKFARLRTVSCDANKRCSHIVSMPSGHFHDPNMPIPANN